ncbi:MAG: hypothetical protein GY906_28290 [bacterium]|nr:hypothetical protein [bacterium]
MALFLVKNDAASSVYKTKQLVVAAEDAAAARLIAATYFDQDSSWASAIVSSALAEETLDAAGSMLGWRFDITIDETPTNGPESITYTGAAGEDLDAVMAEIVILLNAMDDVAGAAYVAPDLTVAVGSGGDDLGDQAVRIQIYHPDSPSLDISAILVVAITDEGAAAADLAIEFKADTVAKPEVLEEA